GRAAPATNDRQPSSSSHPRAYPGAPHPLPMTVPAVSVLMSVHDGAPSVAEAVASVLAQSAGDLELIVVDDGSTDATPDLLAAVSDGRPRVLRQARTGLTRALNRALGAARADLVARLDADDVALPARLARQRAFLERALAGRAQRRLPGLVRALRAAAGAGAGAAAPRASRHARRARPRVSDDAVPVLHVLVSTQPGGGPQHVLTAAVGLRARGWRPLV